LARLPVKAGVRGEAVALTLPGAVRALPTGARRVFLRGTATTLPPLRLLLSFEGPLDEAARPLLALPVSLTRLRCFFLLVPCWIVAVVDRSPSFFALRALEDATPLVLLFVCFSLRFDFASRGMSADACTPNAKGRASRPKLQGHLLVFHSNVSGNAKSVSSLRARRYRERRLLSPRERS
jgi:hypothetical protein